MKVVLKDKKLNENPIINIGDLLVFNDSTVFMIVSDGNLFHGVQIANNGNQELGTINYSDEKISMLRDKLLNDFGKLLFVKKMTEVELSIFR